MSLGLISATVPAEVLCMADCPFYEHRTTFLPNGTKTQGKRSLPPSVSWLEWCTHAYSPCTRADLTVRLDKKLACGGERSRCSIPPEHFADDTDC
jgi:hypothetical protein